MTTALAKATPTSLKSLAREIQDEHLMCEQAAESAIQHAIRAGELLIEAKEQVAHGEWLPWLATIEVPERMAQRYMQIARNPTRVSDLESQRQALAELAESRGPVPAPSNGGNPESDYNDEPELVEAEIVEDNPPSPADPGPRVKCPTCGHMVKPNDIGAWNE